MDDTVVNVVIRSLRRALRGPFAGSVVRVIDVCGADLLVTPDIHCDRPLRPRDLVWYKSSDLRLLVDMEVIGAMAL